MPPIDLSPFFDLKVIFSGLVLLCVEGQQPCRNTTTAYLVNAAEERTVCTLRLDGDHHPKLAFHSRHKLPGATHAYHIEPAPEGGNVVVASLEGLEVCIRTQGRRGGSPRSRPRPTDGVRLRGGRSPAQQHPVTLRADYRAFDWIADMTSMDERVADKGFCPQVNGPLKHPADGGLNDHVISRVRIDRGTLMTGGCSHKYEGFWKRLTAQDYIVWELTEDPPPETDFPKTLPDQIVWKIEAIPDDTLILIQTCGPDPETLFRLDSKGRDLELHVSNLPEHHVLSGAGPHIEHFRWFYRLVDWQEDGCATSHDRCPADVRLPTLREVDPAASEVVWGVTSETLHCPPAGSGSG